MLKMNRSKFLSAQVRTPSKEEGQNTAKPRLSPCVAFAPLKVLIRKNRLTIAPPQ